MFSYAESWEELNKRQMHSYASDYKSMVFEANVVKMTTSV